MNDGLSTVILPIFVIEHLFRPVHHFFSSHVRAWKPRAAVNRGLRDSSEVLRPWFCLPDGCRDAFTRSTLRRRLACLAVAELRSEQDFLSLQIHVKKLQLR